MGLLSKIFKGNKVDSNNLKFYGKQLKKEKRKQLLKRISEQRKKLKAKAKYEALPTKEKVKVKLTPFIKSSKKAGKEGLKSFKRGTKVVLGEIRKSKPKKVDLGFDPNRLF